MVDSCCTVCGFELWAPLAQLTTSTVGLYDDARYPGRLLVSVHNHYDYLDQLPPAELHAFMNDVRSASRVLRGWDDVDRVNVAVLGNNDPHVHAHVVPRRRTDPNRGYAPWDRDDRRPIPLEPTVKAAIAIDLRRLLSIV